MFTFFAVSMILLYVQWMNTYYETILLLAQEKKVLTETDITFASLSYKMLLTYHNKDGCVRTVG